MVRASVVIAVAVISCISPPSLRAQTDDCSLITDVGDRMKCKHGAVLDEQYRIIGNLETNFGGIVNPDNFERLRKANTRAKNAHGRMDGKKFKVGKKHPDDQGQNNQNQSSNEGDDTDLAVMADMEDNYDDVIKNIKAANDLMENNGDQIASMAEPLLAAGAPVAMAGSVSASYAPVPACQTTVDWFTYGRVLTMTIMKQVAVGLKGIADIADKGCDQDAAGFNASVACIVFEGAAAGMALVVETTDGIFSIVKWGIDSSSQQCISTLSADLQEAKAKLSTVVSTSSGNTDQLNGVIADVQDLKAKTNNISTAVNSLNNSVNGLQQQITNLNGTMNTRFNETNLLLSTPQGLRTNFPAK